MNSQPQQQPPAYSGTPQQQVVVQHVQQPMVAVQPGQAGTVATTVQPTRNGNWKGLRITGYMQVVLAVLAVLFGIISIVIKCHLSFIGTPIWCGILFFLTAGLLGIASAGKQDNCMVVAYMVMSIFASLAACCVIGFSSGGITSDTYNCPEDWYGSTYYSRYGYGSTRCSTSKGGRVAVDVLILVVGIAEFIISIVGACLTCSGLCSSRPPSATVVTYQSYPQQMVVGAPPQGVFYPPGTVPYPNQGQFVVQPQQQYPAQPVGQFQPPPQGQYPPQQPQGQYPPQQPQGQYPPQQPQGQSLPQQPQGQVHPEAPLVEKENYYQPLTK